MFFVKIKLSVDIKSRLSITYPPLLTPLPLLHPFLTPPITTPLLTTLPLLHPLRTPLLLLHPSLLPPLLHPSLQPTFTTLPPYSPTVTTPPPLQHPSPTYNALSIQLSFPLQPLSHR